jgi:hypothetical protein
LYFAFRASQNLNIDLQKAFEDANIALDTSNCTDFAYFLYGSYITRVGVLDLSKATIITGLLSNAVRIETIDKIIWPTSNISLNNVMDYCRMLKNVTFEGEIKDNFNLQRSTLLTSASIESIINHLSDAATGKTLTLSLTAVDNAYGWYLPDGSFAGGSNSGAWLELIAPKVENGKWIINLV